MTLPDPYGTKRDVENRSDLHPSIFPIQLHSFSGFALIMSPMSRAHPLETPEILSLIGSYVPAWEDTTWGLRLAPRAMISCNMIKKTWRQVMLPHLWMFFDDDAMVAAQVPLKYFFKKQGPASSHLPSQQKSIDCQHNSNSCMQNLT